MQSIPLGSLSGLGIFDLCCFWQGNTQKCSGAIPDCWELTQGPVTCQASIYCCAVALAPKEVSYSTSVKCHVTREFWFRQGLGYAVWTDTIKPRRVEKDSRGSAWEQGSLGSMLNHS